MEGEPEMCSRKTLTGHMEYFLVLPSLGWEILQNFGGETWKRRVWGGEGSWQGAMHRVHHPKQPFSPGEDNWILSAEDQFQYWEISRRNGDLFNELLKEEIRQATIYIYMWLL